MAIVFVHGVNNRMALGFKERAAVIGAYLSKYVSPVLQESSPIKKVSVDFPYWGDHAASFAWDMASLPGAKGNGNVEFFGERLNRLGGELSWKEGADSAAGALDLVAKLPVAAPSAEPLLALAKQDFSGAVRILLAASSERVRRLSGTPPEDIVQTNANVWHYAAGFAEGERPPWLDTVTTDEMFVTRLLAESTGLRVEMAGFTEVEAMGVFSDAKDAIVAAGRAVSDAAKALLNKTIDAGGRAASELILDATREGLNANMGRFFGDVFVYLKGRGPREALSPIQDVIVRAFRSAKAEKGPLVIIGHSLGGVISYDLLTSVANDIEVDLFVSVGSQVSHFEEQKLYTSSDPRIGAPRRVTKPDNILHWLNVFDPVDIFSYRCDPVFDGMSDFEFDTGTYVIKAHGAYFDQVTFYEHLATRIRGFFP